MNPKTEMPRYHDRRVTTALEIESVVNINGDHQIYFTDMRFAPCHVSQIYIDDHNPQPKGFFTITGIRFGYMTAEEFKKTFKAINANADALAARPEGCDALIELKAKLQKRLYGPDALTSDEAFELAKRVIEVRDELHKVFPETKGKE